MPVLGASDGGGGAGGALRTNEAMPNMGEGESHMMNFIQAHMTYILQPIAEHVKELRQQTCDLQHATGQLTSRAGQTDQSLEQHGQKLTDISSSLSQAHAGLETANAGIADVGRRHRTLEIEHGATRSGLGKAEEELRTQGSSVVELQRLQKETDAHLKAIQEKLDESAATAEKNRNVLVELKGFTEGLNVRHIEHLKSHQESKKLGLTVEQTLRNFMSATNKQTKENGVTFMRLDERTKAVEDGLRHCNTQIQVNASQFREKLGSTEDDMRQITTKLTALDGIVQEWQSQMMDAQNQQKGPAGRLQKAEQQLVKFSEFITAGQKENRRLITELGDRVSKNAQDIAVVDHTQVTHVDHLRRIAHRAGDLESNGERLSGRMDRAEANVNSLTVAKEDVVRRLEVHAFDLKQKDSQLGKARADLDSTSQRLEGHDADLSSNAQVLARIGTRLELAFEYFQGMGRGFRDTHRKVIGGEDGMLPPKSGMAKTLPTIPSASMGKSEAAPGAAAGYSTGRGSPSGGGTGTRAAWASPSGALTSR